MKISTLVKHLEQIAPAHLQETYDNSGLIVGRSDQNVSAALITLDCTEAVVAEAIELGANLIIAHHPIVFSGLKRFNGKNYVERTVMMAIKNDIAIYAIHTNLDAVMDGVNSMIARKLQLHKLKILQSRNDDGTIGAGMIGEFREAIDVKAFLERVKIQFNVPFIKHTKVLKPYVQKIAFCGGSGSFLLEDAKAAEADVFLSSDFKYHQYFDAEEKLVIADIGHYEAEIFTKDLIYEILTEKFPTFTLHFSKENTNPVNYF